MNTTINRRQTLQSIGIASLACSLPAFALAEEEKSPIQINDWLDRLYAKAQLLRSKKISSLQWQEAMDVIYDEVPLPALEQKLDFASLRKEILDAIGSERGELFRRVDLPGNGHDLVNGKEPHRALIVKVAHVKKGRSIPPHGHSNMTSAFLCLSGEFAVRQYDKLEDTEKEMVLRQTVDDPAAGIGTWSSISDYRNNVHWLTANTDDCYLFTCKMIGVEANRPLHGRINVDVHKAKVLGSSTLRAPKISHKQAAELY